MTDVEPAESYFEIQLDRGTVALAGLGFTALLVLAFLLGSWWGARRAVAGEPSGAQEGVAAADGGGEPAETEELVVDGRPPFGEEAVSARGAPVRSPVPAASEAQVESPGPPQRETSEPVPERPTTDARREAAPETRRPTRAASVPSSRGWVVQVTAVRSLSDAEALRRRLAGRGWDVRTVSDAGLHKVQVGPFVEREDAEQAERRLKTEERLATWLHRE